MVLNSLFRDLQFVSKFPNSFRHDFQTPFGVQQVLLVLLDLLFFLSCSACLSANACFSVEPKVNPLTLSMARHFSCSVNSPLCWMLKSFWRSSWNWPCEKWGIPQNSVTIFFSYSFDFRASIISMPFSFLWVTSITMIVNTMVNRIEVT